MGKFKESDNHKGVYLFWCPGCKSIHSIITKKQNYPSPVWEFNEDTDKPTVSPSIKVMYHHPKMNKKDGKTSGGWRGEYIEDICHSFVKDGKIQFLSDCTHELAGKTVDIPNWDDSYFEQQFKNE